MEVVINEPFRHFILMLSHANMPLVLRSTVRSTFIILITGPAPGLAFPDKLCSALTKKLHHWRLKEMILLSCSAKANCLNY